MEIVADAINKAYERSNALGRDDTLIDDIRCDIANRVHAIDPSFDADAFHDRCRIIRNMPVHKTIKKSHRAEGRNFID